MDCLFCKIVNNEINSYKVYEDDKVLAFLDIHPHGNGHTLIIPKEHFQDFSNIPDDLLLHINQVAKKITKELETKLKATGFCINTNYLEAQDIKHYHLHIVPMSKEPLKSIEEIYEILKK